MSAMLQRDGWRVNHKRVERIWRQEGLKVPAKQPKRGRLWLNDGSCLWPRPERQDHVWAYDFVAIRTRDGRPVRLLTVVDEYTRECLAIRVGRSLRSSHLIECLGDIMVERGVPEYLRSDNGPRVYRQGGAVMGYSAWEPRHSSSRRGVPGRTGTWRASTES